MPDTLSDREAGVKCPSCEDSDMMLFAYSARRGCPECGYIEHHTYIKSPKSTKEKPHGLPS